MKRPTTLALLVLAALLAGFTLWWRTTSAARSTADAEKSAALRQTSMSFTASAPAPLGLPENRESPSDESATRDPRVVKLFQGLKGGPRRGRISRQAIEAYLETRERSGLSLLAAWQESGDDSYLREAAARFPDDPNVQLAAALSPALAAERGLWRDRMKQADPANPLPHWLAAADHFSTKQTGLAVAELLAADGKTGFNAHTDALIAERQALFEAAGIDPLPAQIEAHMYHGLEYLQRLQSANRGIEAEVTALRGRGDIQTAQDLSVMALNLGRMLTANEHGMLWEQLMGMAVENAALKQIPAAEAGPLLGSDRGQRLAELERKSKEISELGRNADITDGRSSLEEVAEFFRRVQNDGDLAALRWLAVQRAGRMRSP